jgi:hypothetical protein
MGTVTRVRAAMYRQFFAKRPTTPLKVYAFVGKAGYERFVKSEYGRAPSTPYGFYMRSDRAMVMNLDTGTGTLAHEMVHPLLEEDFPGVPAWFNEGFASLFEQSTYDDKGEIRGLGNWRLRALAAALRDGAAPAPALAKVMATTRAEFYGSESGLNYVVARYLCLYLQERELLTRVCRAFRANANEDPTGAATLKEVTGNTPEELQAQWRAWILKAGR